MNVSLVFASGPAATRLVALVVASYLRMGWILGRFSRRRQLAATPTRMHKKVGGEV